MDAYDKAGGTAFPYAEHGAGGETSFADPGMTLRDWFAGQALVGLMSGEGRPIPDLDAAFAYQMADAMLAARALPDHTPDGGREG